MVHSPFVVVTVVFELFYFEDLMIFGVLFVLCHLTAYNFPAIVRFASQSADQPENGNYNKIDGGDIT
jgi:hypothetical protein